MSSCHREFRSAHPYCRDQAETTQSTHQNGDHTRALALLYQESVIFGLTFVPAPKRTHNTVNYQREAVLWLYSPKTRIICPHGHDSTVTGRDETKAAGCLIYQVCATSAMKHTLGADKDLGVDRRPGSASPVGLADSARFIERFHETFLNCPGSIYWGLIWVILRAISDLSWSELRYHLQMVCVQAKAKDGVCLLWGIIHEQKSSKKEKYVVCLLKKTSRSSATNQVL